MTIQPAWQIPRSGLLWLLIAFVGVVIPHVGHLPPWITAGAIVAIGWRLQVYRGCWGFPGIWIKVALLALCIGGLLLSYGLLVGLEPMVALLVSGYSLKLLEMHRPRDALVLVYLGYFVAITLCLFDQSIAVTSYILVGLLLVTAGLVGLHQTAETTKHSAFVELGSLKTAAAILLQAIPLMLVLFLVMPRFAPLWSVPSQRDSATTGVSDSMSPGDFTRLGRSAATAFRVTFAGPMPPKRQLYWRGLVLSDFDGRAWRQAVPWGYAGNLVQWYGQPDGSWRGDIPRSAASLDYSVILEPTQNQWLYALTPSQPLTEGVGLARDHSLVNRVPVTGKREYRARFMPDSPRDLDALPSIRHFVETRLPPEFNPETRRLAAEWRAEEPDNEALMRRLMALFRREFTYTLEPPALGRHSVDEFLWQSKRGFCEHFASSFVFFMRAAGIPARVVVGYQGGEYNPEQDYLTVRQYDAHAWAEVWLEGQGWVEFDPTAAVAPERIEFGMAETLAGEEEFLADNPFSLHRFRDIPWLNRLRLQLDYLDYLWTRWVLRYDGVQEGLLSRMLGAVDPVRIGLFILIAGFLALLPVLLLLWWRRAGNPRSPLEQLYLEFCRKLEKAGLGRNTGEGPRDFAARASARFPADREQIENFSRFFERVRYAGSVDNLEEDRLRQQRRRLKRFRPGAVRLLTSKSA